MSNITKLLESRIELSDSKIHVFLLQLDLFDCSQLISYLSEDEVVRAEQLKVEEKKKQFIIVRGVCRKLLSHALNIDAKEIKFYYGEHKKPYIEEQYNNKSVEFNISHSGNYALVALTLYNKVGVDIEKINHKIDYQYLSKRFFSEKENEELLCLTKGEQLDAFYRAWTRKESFIKATGKGIAFGLDRFSVSLEDNVKCRIVIDSSELINEQWYCYNVMNVENYKMALASCNNNIDIVIHQ